MSLSSTLSIFVPIGSFLTFLGVIYYNNTETINSGISRAYQYLSSYFLPTQTSQTNQENQETQTIQETKIDEESQIDKNENAHAVIPNIDLGNINFIREYSAIQGSNCEFLCDFRL